MELTIDKKQELRRKAGILKRYEIYGYQVAYYLLENEALAEQAAMNALTEMLHNAPFFLQSPQQQQQSAKQAVIRHSLLIKGAASKSDPIPR